MHSFTKENTGATKPRNYGAFLNNYYTNKALKMALIGKIRKNFWFVLILLGLALAAFILMDMTSAGNAAGGATSMTMGSVAGEKINYGEFQRTESAYYGGSQGDLFSKRNSIWDFFVERALLNKEAGSLGLSVSKEELMDLQFGPNQSDIVKNNWTDPQTGQLNQASLNEFKRVIEDQEDMNPQFRAYWAEQEKQIIKQSVQGKLNSLINKSVYTPNWLAEETHKMDNTKVDFNFIKIPFDNIDGTGIEVSDADLTNYAKSKGDKYVVNVETREIEYATFTVVPSAADTANIIGEVSALKTEFLATQDDSTFTVANRGQFNHIYGTKDQMPVSAADQIVALNPGEVYGPFTENGFSMIVKMVDKRSIPDSVKARHILVAAADPVGFAAASAEIDSIRQAYKSGSSFESLAAAHSDDGSNKDNGGELAVATQATWVPEFTKVAFTGSEGGLYTVRTQFGVHLLEVLDQIYNEGDRTKYKVASVGKPIIPSQETQDAVYDKVTEIMAGNKEISALRTALEAYPEAGLTSSAPLRANDFTLGTLGSGQTVRDIVQWAYNPSTEVGDVSPDIYRFRDQVNYFDGQYVVASLSTVIPKGMQPTSALRNTISTLVLNKKKAEKFAAGLTGYGSLQEVASANGVTVETASDVGSKSATITGVGREQNVLAHAFGLGINSISKPIVGETGVFLVQPISRAEAGAATNLGFIKGNVSRTTKSQVDFNIIKNMKKRANVKDDRATFF